VEEKGYLFFPISAAAHMGTEQLIKTVAGELSKLPPVRVYEPEYVKRAPEIGTAQELQIQVVDGTWIIEGPWLERLMSNINFGDFESRTYFDKQLRAAGLFDRLETMGIQDGDIVSLYDLEFEYQR
jgi:GTP-binding protein